MRVRTKAGFLAWFSIVGVAAASASADVPKVGAVAPITFKRTALKESTQPAGTLSAADHAKVRAALDSALTAYGQHKDPKKLLAAGAGLTGDAAAAFQIGASRATARRSATPGAGGGGSAGVAAAGSTPTASAMAPTYAIEAGDVVNATFVNPCDGNVELSFTVKNRGAKLPDGVTPRLVVSLARGTGAEITSAWVNLPSLSTGATATVQVPALRHRAPGSNGACPTDTVVVTPSFVDVAALSEYRLRIDLRPDGADATLLSGRFAAPRAPTDDCAFGDKKCAPGVCASICPPCPTGYTEYKGGCYPSWWGGLEGGLTWR